MTLLLTDSPGDVGCLTTTKPWILLLAGRDLSSWIWITSGRTRSTTALLVWVSAQTIPGCCGTSDHCTKEEWFPAVDLSPLPELKNGERHITEKWYGKREPKDKKRTQGQREYRIRKTTYTNIKGKDFVN